MESNRPTPPPITERAVFWLLLAVLAAAPMPAGGRAAWAWSLLAASTGVLVLVWSAGAVVRAPAPGAPWRRLWPPAVLYIAVVVWAAVQAMAMAPQGWRHPLWSEAAALLDTPLAATLSLDPARTAAGATRLLAYGGVFMLAFGLGARRDRAMAMLRGVVCIALGYTLYGLAVTFLGLDAGAGQARELSSTFLDRNAFATYAGLALIGATALLFRPKIRPGDVEAGWRFALRVCLDYFFSRSFASMTAAAVLFIAVVQTHSRAGLLATLVGISVFLFTATRGWRSRKPVVLATLAIGLGGAVILAAGGSGTAKRMALAPDAMAERAEVYRLTAQAIAEAPVTGTGYGTFRYVFPAYRSERLLVPFLHGHNLYLENALELGVPAAGALVAAVAWIGLLCARGSRNRGRDAFFPSLGAAVTVLVAVHSLFDSTLRFPALAMTFAALLGLACGQTLGATTAEAGEAASGRR